MGFPTVSQHACQKLSHHCAISEHLHFRHETTAPICRERDTAGWAWITTSLTCISHISYTADLGAELKRTSIYNDAIRSQQIIWASIVLCAPTAALILILTVLLLIKMALYYTLPIVILNKMAVKLDFLSCRRADVISSQSQRSRINSVGGSLMLTAGFLKGEGGGGKKIFYRISVIWLW